MIGEVVGMMAVSKVSATAPSAPTAANESVYGASLVQVNWTEHGSAAAQGWKTRVYRKVSFSSYTLLATVDQGVGLYQTGHSAASGYSYAVAHYDPVTGMESIYRTVTDLPPDEPTGVTQYTYSGTKIGVEWNSHAYHTRCYKLVSGSYVLQTTKNPGTTNWDTGQTSGSFAVSAYNSSTGQESDKVSAGA
jgi:hypothetical protein